MLTFIAVNWLRVLGSTEPSQIDQGIGHQLHPIVPTLEVLETQQQPLEFVLPRKWGPKRMRVKNYSEVKSLGTSIFSEDSI